MVTLEDCTLCWTEFVSQRGIWVEMKSEIALE